MVHDERAGHGRFRWPQFEGRRWWCKLPPAVSVGADALCLHSVTAHNPAPTARSAHRNHAGPARQQRLGERRWREVSELHELAPLSDGAARSPRGPAPQAPVQLPRAWAGQQSDRRSRHVSELHELAPIDSAAASSPQAPAPQMPVQQAYALREELRDHLRAVRRLGRDVAGLRQQARSQQQEQALEVPDFGPDALADGFASAAEVPAVGQERDTPLWRSRVIDMRITRGTQGAQTPSERGAHYEAYDQLVEWPNPAGQDGVGWRSQVHPRPSQVFWERYHAHLEERRAERQRGDGTPAAGGRRHDTGRDRAASPAGAEGAQAFDGRWASVLTQRLRNRRTASPARHASRAERTARWSAGFAGARRRSEHAAPLLRRDRSRDGVVGSEEPGALARRPRGVTPCSGLASGTHLEGKQTSRLGTSTPPEECEGWKMSVDLAKVCRLLADVHSRALCSMICSIAHTCHPSTASLWSCCSACCTQLGPKQM